MLRTAETALGGAVCLAVLAFGGTSTIFSVATQLLLLTVGALFLSANLGSPLTSIPLPRTTPLLLIALVLLQLLPLSRSHAPAFETAGGAFHGRDWSTFSIAPYQTISQLLLLVTYIVTFYLVILVCQDRNARARIVYGLVALGTFEAFYGLLQYLTGWQHIFMYVKKYYLSDATGTYINRNHFAGFLEMVLPFAVCLALRQAGILRHAAMRKQAQFRGLLSQMALPRFVFWSFLATTLFTALIFSRSRMGIISALFSLLVVFTLAGVSGSSLRTRAVLAGVLFVGAAGLVVWIGSDPVVTRFEALKQDSIKTDQSRVGIWRDTLKLVHQYPLLGTGLGTFSVAYPSVQTVFLNLFVDHAHCDYLEVVTELGLPGGILVFGSILSVLTQAIRHYPRAYDSFASAVSLASVGSITAILVHGMADFNLHIPANALVFVVVLALAWSVSHPVFARRGTALPHNTNAPSLTPPRANLLGVGIHAVNLSMAADFVCCAVATRQKGYLCVTGVHGIMEAQRDPEFRDVLSRALLVTPDGMPTVWVGRLQGYVGMQRVFGPDLMTEICARSAARGIRHFFYGGNPGVADELAEILRGRFPGISIAGTFTPPFRSLEPTEQTTLHRVMEAVRPDIVWVGLGTPKQEKFMAENIDRLPCKIMIGVGAAFDIYTGHLKDAPSWMKKSGLQWLHRLCQEPHRLWKRYLVNNSAFLLALALQLSGLRHYALPIDHAGIPSR